MKRLLCILSLAFLVGCASSGKKMDADKLAQIQPGKTTRQEIAGWFGSPVFQGLDTNGKMSANWQYTQAQSYGFHTQMKSQILSVIFDANGVVEKFTLVDDINK